MGQTFSSTVEFQPPVRPESDSSEGSQKSAKALSNAPKPTSGLIKSQLHADFCKVPLEQRDAVNLMRDCYKLNGGKLSEKLNSCIDTLVQRIHEDEGGSHADIKSRIVDVIKEAKPAAAPTCKPASSIKVTTVDDDDSSSSSVASSLSFHTATTTESAAAKKPARVPSFVSIEKDLVSKLNKVAAKTGVLKELIKHKEGLESAKAGESLQKEIAKAIKEIEALPDMASFNKALDEVKTRVDTIAKAMSTEKKSIVDMVRQTELKNRKEHELLKPVKQVVDEIRSGGKTSESTDIPGEAAKKAGQRWLGNAKYNETLRNAAVHRYQRLRSELNSSLQDVAEPNRPQVELNNAKLDALAKKFVEFETAEKERLLVLKKEKREARKAGDYEKLQDQTKLVEACKAKIKGFNDKTDLLSKIQRTVSAADTDIKHINGLADRFNATSDIKAKANVLPFSLPMLANGVESLSVTDGFSLNRALKYGPTGKANHAMSRALALRTNLSELGSYLNGFEYSVNSPPKMARGETRSFLMDLSGSLRNPGGPDSEKVLRYFGAADISSPKLSDKNGRIFIHKLAASNVSAAGFNAVTLRLDAPSLAYKVESGFSSIKKFMPGRVGVYARNPSEHLGNRLNALSELSSTLQAEVFKDGAPVDLKAAVITPQHAVEASSLILAALPNDLLTTNHDEVTTFMKSLKEFEGKVEDAEENKESVANEDLESFKKRINQFHEQAASWVLRREVPGSVAVAREISHDIAVNGRKGIFRRAPVALGNFINLAGGKAIRESFSAIRNYVSTVNQKERLRQQFGHSENIATVSRLKQQLQPLANSKNEAEANNARALITYLEGKSLSVKLEGPLSLQLERALLAVGDFLQKAWEPRSNGKPAPKVIGLSSIQTNSIRKYATTNLARFAADATVPVQATAPTVAPTAARPNTTQSSSKLSGVAPDLKPEAAANVKANDAKQPSASNEEWIVNVWRDLLGSDPEAMAKLKADYKRNFEFHYPKPDYGSSAEHVQKYNENLRSLDTIAKYVNEQGGESGVLKQMSDLLPVILTIEGGNVINGQLTPLGQRTIQMQNVYGVDNRCWLRSSWGAAVSTLSRDEFINKVGSASKVLSQDPLRNNKSLGSSEIGQIYDQIKESPFDGMRNNPALQGKQLALMLAIIGEDSVAWTNRDVANTLQLLRMGEEVQAEQDFIISFLRALDLPVIIHSNSTSVPDIRLPKSFDLAKYGHPDTWPTIWHSGGANFGHYQFYPKMNNEAEQVGA